MQSFPALVSSLQWSFRTTLEPVEGLAGGRGGRWIRAWVTVLAAIGGAGAVEAAGPGVYSISTYAGRSAAGAADGKISDAQFYFPAGVALDAAGNVYVADQGNAVIRKITPAGEVTTLAGKAGERGATDGAGAEARFAIPIALAISPAGDLYVGARSDTMVRKISPGGVVTTFAGVSGQWGHADGTGAAARFTGIEGLACDGAGNLFVADHGNRVIRKITPGGVVSTIAGGVGLVGSADGQGSAARFDFPAGIGLDAAGNLYVVDNAKHTVRKIAPGGLVTTLAGSAGVSGGADGTGGGARFNFPTGLAVGPDGSVYVADSGNYKVRQISPAGVVTTWVGAGYAGNADGVGTAATFMGPQALAFDAAGNLLVADTGAHRIRKVNPTRGVGLFAGIVAGNVDGPRLSARFYLPQGLATDAAGNLFAADSFNQTIRKISPTGLVSTLAGSPGVAGSADGAGSGATFYYPDHLAVDPAGNVFVGDMHANVIRKITPQGVVTTWAGVAGQVGYVDGDRAVARFYSPKGLAFDAAGNLWVADQLNNVLRVISPAGMVRTVAGRARSDPESRDGSGEAARFSYPFGVAVDRGGNVYLTESNSSAIRRVTPEGIVTTFAGSAGMAGSADGVGTVARFRDPTALVFDAEGNLFVADSGNHAVRRITPAGVVSTIAGGSIGTKDGAGAGAQFYVPTGVAMDAQGRLFIADYGNGTIRLGIPAVLPTITKQPESQGVVTGQAVTFTVEATAEPAASYQWSFNGEAIGGATGHSFTVPSAQLSQSGSYTVKATNAVGSATSHGAILVVHNATGAPVVGRQPQSRTVAPGSTVVFSVGVAEVLAAAAGNEPRAASVTTTYQWYLDGVAIAGATGARLEVAGTDQVRAGDYACVLANASGATLAGPASLIIANTGSPGQLVNLSFLSRAGGPGEVMAAGFVTTGSGAMPVLIRAGGPILKELGVTEFAPTPSLVFYDAGGKPLGANAGWGGDASIASAAARLGAYSWGAQPSPDAALLATLPVGLYSAQISSRTAQSGVALFEVYDATAEESRTANSPRLVNLSSLAKAGGETPLIVGFVIAGKTARTVLVRAGGPALKALGVSGYLAAPKLELFDARSVSLEANAGWAGDPAIKRIAETVGAYSWGAAATPDAAILVTLPPGAYSAIANSSDGGSGVVLLELYEVP